LLGWLRSDRAGRLAGRAMRHRPGVILAYHGGKSMKYPLALLAFLALPAPALLLPVATAPAQARAACPIDGHYVNSRGNCVRRPVQSASAPAGATARCRDGSYSFSQNRRGTCSRHGGVAAWL